jgi:serine/threonine-protein kinase
LVRPNDRDDYVGKRIAQKYRIEQLIGEGGMGKVYRANQLALDKPVVLKVLRQSLLSDERTVARFQREAKAASRLNHPNSISILDFGQAEDGALYIAMEYVNGRDLQQILAKEWPLPEGRVSRVMSQVLSALADAHQAGVIHRDLKPENIMVEPRRGGETDFVKVLDFGIAKIQDSQDDGPALTRAGFVCGTPEYMSPEQARGAPLDARSDLYAVGVILYQLTTGMLPFESDSAVGFATKHLTETPLPPSQKRPDIRISPGMERLILRSLAKDPNDRPQHADAFRADLIAVERERRQSQIQRRNGEPATSPAPMAVLGPVPKRVTSHEDTATQMTDPGWTNDGDKTIRAFPDELTRTVDRPSPPPPALNARTSPSEPGVRSASRSWGIWAALGLLAVACGVGGLVLYRARKAEEARRIAVAKSVKLPKVPLYLLEVPESRWDTATAAQRALEGDQAHHRNEAAEAAQKYREAFEHHPAPEYALKLGELSRLNGDSEEALGWWKRHLRDRPDSRARAYIAHFYPELGKKP